MRYVAQRVGDHVRRGAGQPGLDQHHVRRAERSAQARGRRTAAPCWRRARSRRAPRSRRGRRRAPDRARPPWRRRRGVRRGSRRPVNGRARWSGRPPARSAARRRRRCARSDGVDLGRRRRGVDVHARAGCPAARRRRAPGGCGRPRRCRTSHPSPTRTPPTSWWPKPSLTCSKARSTRNEPNVCTIGRIPVSARPAPTLTSSCSRMPTLITRSGWRASTSPKNWPEISAYTSATDGSVSTRSAAVRANWMRGFIASPPRRRRRRWAGRPDGATGPSRGRRGRARRRRRCASPRPANRSAIRPGTAYDDDRLSTTTTVSASSDERGGQLERLVVAALVELRVADEYDDPGADALGAQAERRADRQRETVTERAGGDLHAGHQVAVGVEAERRVERCPVGQPRLREEARGRRAPRSRPSARAPWTGRTGRGAGRRSSRARRRAPARRAPGSRRGSRWPRTSASRRRSSGSSGGESRSCLRWSNLKLS